MAWICSVAFFTALAALNAYSQNVASEYKLKAVFLFNFVQFVEWPTNSFANEQSPIVIGILGPDPFGKDLEETVKGEIVRGRPIVVRHYKSPQESLGCHVLFINSSEKPKLKSILATLKGRSILTVSDMEDFASSGGMIRFVKDKNRIRFRINVEAAKDANLAISSKLLQLAEIVTESRP